MLRQWSALNSDSAPQAHQKETSEQLEQRLRAQYEEGLSHQRNDTQRTVQLLSELSNELSLPQKRPRIPQPLWKRRLRYAVNRNLAAAHDALNQPLKATHAYAIALDDDNSDFLVWSRAARAAAQSGTLHVARRAYETALKLRPFHCLALNPHKAVIRAIGDDDEDVQPSVSQQIDSLAAEMIEKRCQLVSQQKAHREEPKQPECIKITELSWAYLVESLRTCLLRRLQSAASPTEYAVGHPVIFEVDRPSGSSPSPQSSDDVQVVMETHAATRNDEAEVIQVPTDGQSDVDHDTHGGTPRPVTGGPSEPEQSQPPISTKPSTTSPIPAVADHMQVDGKSHDCVTEERGSANSQEAIDNDADLVGQKGPIATDQGQMSSTDPPKPSNITRSLPAQIDGYNETDKSAKGTTLEPKKPEVRRSTRTRTTFDLTADAERRKTRNVTGMIDVEALDAELVQTMLDICVDRSEENRKVSSGISGTQDMVPDDKLTSNSAREDVCMKQRACLWTEIVDERTEVEKVQQCITRFGENNSGPADLLLRLLGVLSGVSVIQYSSTLAVLWSTLRGTLQLHMPGSAEVSALIAESMISSGRKAGKVKAQRFLEAARLLSNIDVSTPAQEEDVRFLEIRLSWCWALLYECKGEMQLSFSSTERTLCLLEAVEFDKSRRIPESAGPDLAGYSYTFVRGLIKDRLTRLKSARDLEKAEEELKRASKGDVEAAKRTIAILGASVQAAVRSLKLDKWDGDDLKTTFEDKSELELWEARLDSEVELEPRIRVFGDACAKAADMVGELICFSIRLRMAVRYYAAAVRSEVEKDSSSAKCPDSSEGRLADLLVQIRKFVALIKKITTSSASAQWNRDEGITGWSMENGMSIASVTLVSLTKLLTSKVPILKFSNGTELGASQKNRRLGLTRCMLAFARCVHVMEKCRHYPISVSKEKLAGRKEESLIVKKMLFTTSFCLRTLVARGCCREEGTSGALMKLYVKFLLLRLQDLATMKENYCTLKQNQPACRAEEEGSVSRVLQPFDVRTEREAAAESQEEEYEISYSAESEDETPIPRTDMSYGWRNVKVIRNELAQCYQCLYRIPDIETGASVTQGSSERWLEEGCRLSKQIGLSFTTGDPLSASPTIEVDACCSIYFFYRNRIFELFSQQQREGGRGKRLREVLSRLAEALPEDAPRGVPMLPFQALDTIVSDVVDSSEDISRHAAENVSKLEEEWIREKGAKCGKDLSETQLASNVRFSVLYFEVFSLHAMSILCAYSSEYKKHKSAERRKHPKEAVDRVLAASSESLVALRSRPWSVGSWILLGRIFVETADLALDERELNLSTFGIPKSEGLQSLGEGDCIATIFGRAEACFGFAESLLRHSWAENACNESLPVTASSVLGFAYNGNGQNWKGFGDNGDMFGLFGLTNQTTSRPRLKHEEHPAESSMLVDSRRLAAIRFGSAALSLLRVREERYFHLHWTLSSLEPKLLTHPRNRFPDPIINLSTLALNQLCDAQNLYGMSDAPIDSPSVPNPVIPVAGPNVLPDLSWRKDYIGIEKLKWFYSLLEAKLLRKVGKPAAEYLAVFGRSLAENKKIRDHLKQPCDIEPLYQLHAARMKILRNVESCSSATETLNLLETYSFHACSPPSVEGFPGKDIEDWIAERKTAVAEDILAAMQTCSSRKSDVSYSEFYFKSAFCKAVLLADILKDIGAALEELGKCFRLDAAVKALDQGQDAHHRGYFFKIWNYRFTDTGVEPAIETERKLVRWRSKLLGFYGQLLKQTEDWRSLAAIIYRLKKRNPEDLPVDGALLDDLLDAYAVTSRTALLSSMEKSIVTDVSAFESSYHRTWIIFEESLRLYQGVRRVRVGLHRGEVNETGGQRLVRSGRPRCLVSMHTVLRLEHIRWKSAFTGVPVDLDEMRSLPTEGGLRQITHKVRIAYVNTLQESERKWKLDEKMAKLLLRRIHDLSAIET